MSSKNNNKLNVPEAREAMDKFKMECANEVGVDQMVKRMIESYENSVK